MASALLARAPPWRLAGRLADGIAAERGRFLPWVPVLMAIGVIGYFAQPTEPSAWIGPTLFPILLALGLLARGTALRAPCWIAASLALGLAAAQFATWRAPAPIDIPTHATQLSGTVGQIEALPKGLRITLDHPSLDGGPPLARMIRVRLRASDTGPVSAGDRLSVRAMLMRPAPPAYPGAWDLQRDAFFNGLAAYGYALAPATRTAVAAPGPTAWLQSLRQSIARRIAGVLAGPEAAIATTLLTGGSAGVPPADRAAFRDSGLAHLLAIAGLHIGIVMGLVFGAVRRALVQWEHAALHWPTKRIAALAALAAGAGYLLLTGAHVPILRSFAMACLVTLGVLVGRRAISLRGLALAMAAVILLAPNEVLGVSFQMSFSAVLALIAGYAALRPWLTRLYGDGAWHRRLRSHIVALALTSALAGTFSAPFAAYHFGHVQIYYVIANILAVPLTAFWIMPAALLSLLLMPFHLEAAALVPMSWGIDAVLAIARHVAAWPAAVIAVPKAPDWGLAILALGLAWLGLWRSRLRLFGLAAIALGLLSPALVRPPDLLVSADARLIALRSPSGVFEQSHSGASGFTRDAWLSMWAAKAATPLPTEGGEGALACTAAACRLTAGARHAVLLRGSSVEGHCDADLLLSAEPIAAGCPGVPRIDRFTVWRDGAAAAWLAPEGVRILTDRASRGDRPWVPRPPTRTRLQPGLPTALAEPLPAE